MWLNAAWAAQGTRYVRDALGISTGEPDQTYALPTARAVGAQRAPASAQLTARDAAEFERALDHPLSGVPVLGNETVEVREWSGRGDDWETAVAGVPTEDLRFEADPQDPSIKTAVWVRWHAQPHLYASGRSDRHYVVERARGVFRFPRRRRRVPPAGAPIVVRYVDRRRRRRQRRSRRDPRAAQRRRLRRVGQQPAAVIGGAVTESLRSARDRSAQTVRHRDRAVSHEDFEWLAHEASSEVARARALPLESPAGRGGRGFVGIVIVPHSIDPMPMPSRELTARVIEHLRRRAPAGIAGGIRVITPSYVKVGVRAEILPLRADEAGKVEARVRAQLARFPHPLTGGRDRLGWEFGQAIYLSDVARADRAHARRRRGALSAVDDRFGRVWRSRPSLARAADRCRRIAAEDYRSERALCPCLSPRSTTASIDQLVAEGRAQIPRLAPRWTDHNASDPGITLLELAAWLSEQNIYRFDRPSDEALRGFARLLLNDEPRAAAIASTVVAVRNVNAAAVKLPPRMQLASAETELFETQAALHVSPAQLLQPGRAMPRLRPLQT